MNNSPIEPPYPPSPAIRDALVADDAYTRGLADGQARMRSRVEALANAWAAIPPYLASDYDRGRAEQRQMCETELREVLEPHEDRT